MCEEITSEKKLNKEGLFPAKEETKEQFLKRAHYCLSLKQNFAQEFPFLNKELTTNQDLKEAFSLSDPLFGITPTWIPLLFSNHKLPFWQGGCAWIFQKTQTSPLGAFFQLRQNFKKKATYLGIYERKELLAHEMAHVARSAYQEPKFEEILAYRSSLSPLRRWFGPLFQSSLESCLFVLFLFIIALLNLFSLMEASALFWMGPSLSLCFLFLGSLLIRLFIRQRQLKSCLASLTTFMKDPNLANQLLFRLTDQEIVLFSKLNQTEMQKQIKNQMSYRWEFLKTVYF